LSFWPLTALQNWPLALLGTNFAPCQEPKILRIKVGSY
jgi:hypothetical protein